MTYRYPQPGSSEITPEASYRSRRQWLRSTALAPLLAASPAALGWSKSDASNTDPAVTDWAAARSELDETLTPEVYATSYNNFYEFGTDKEDPARYAGALTTQPWQVQVSGEVERPGTYDLDDLLRGLSVEDRIYRLRCVEAWSMVIPWQGVQLKDVLNKFKPGPKARYVRFRTLLRPSEMRGQRSRFSSIDWPYVEGLRLDEAMHPLTLLATGMYGKPLPNQNGAPLRLVVPWKYGFKSIKSIVAIEFSRRKPATSWNLLAPQEYGFYANVNPAVSHPRWSQATERRLPSSLFNSNRRDTLPFNGYGEQVAALYAGMDLRRNY